MNERISLYEIALWLVMDWLREFLPEPGKGHMDFVFTPSDMLKQNVITRGNITVRIEYHAANEVLRDDILVGVDAYETE